MSSRSSPSCREVGDRRPERVHPVRRLQRRAETFEPLVGPHACSSQGLPETLVVGIRRPASVPEQETHVFERGARGQVLHVMARDGEAAAFPVHVADRRPRGFDPSSPLAATTSVVSRSCVFMEVVCAP
jgi:hypothetical protein